MSVADFSWFVIIGLGGLAAFVYNVANLAEEGVSDRSKKKFRNIVKNSKASPVFRHSFFTFSLASDAYFGERILSFKSFFRSVFFSLGWFFIISLACVALFPQYRSWFSMNGMGHLVIECSLFLISVVVVLDFISVSFTRLVVRESKPSGALKLFVALGVDFLVSVFIFYIGFSFSKYLILDSSWMGLKASIGIWLNIEQLPMMMKTLSSLTSDMLQAQPDGSTWIKGGLETEIVYAFPEGIAFYSSLLTSAWLWLHTLSYALFKISLSFDKSKKRLVSLSNIDSKPFVSLATIFLVVCAACAPLIVIFYAIFYGLYG